MKPISKLRLFIIAIVALVSIYFTASTLQYYMHLRHRPAVESQRPLPTAPEPGKIFNDDPEQINPEWVKWAEVNGDYIAWAETNQEYVAWDVKSDALRENAIPLGLDLIGGVDVTLAIDRKKAVADKVGGLMDSLKRDLSASKISATFTLADDKQSFTLAVAPVDARTAANVLGELLPNPISEDALANSQSQPVSITIATNEIEDSLKSSIEGTKKAIQDRVDSLGVTQPRISMQGANQIRIQVPGAKDPDKLIRTVIRPAVLEFRIVYDDMNRLLGPDGKIRPGVDIPLGFEVIPGKLGELNRETNQIDYTYQDYVVFRTPQLTGKNLRNAGVTYNPSDFTNPIQVSLEFDDEGTDIFGRVTSENIGRQLAIMLDGIVRSAPTLNDAIMGGRATISGGFSNEEAHDLSQILKAGSLPAPLIIENSYQVGATLGADSILSGVNALVYGSILVTIFMIAYYGTAGVISIFALMLNIFIILAIMSLANATLTLSGIGGILLTIGMAVDANVLIYERIREEIGLGRPLRQALSMGFRRAFTVILDSNMTTLLTALVLLQFTSGSVRGFALTMTFGLLANLFTGLTVTYTLCSLWFMWRGGLSLGKLAMFRNSAFNFIKLRFLSWSLSVIILVGGLILVFAQGGLRFGVDFAGGYRTEVSFTEDVTSKAISQALLEGGLQDPNIQHVIDAENTYIIDVKLSESDEAKSEELGETAATAVLVTSALDKNFGGSDGYTVKMKSSFGSQTGQRFSRMALIVICLASISILGYLWLRFELAFGVAAVIALIHDLAIVVMLATIWNVQITLEVVAALMVLLGFSVNDTIVIFDRIRENSRSLFGKSFKDICNMSINQSLARTIVTSGTTFIAILMLLLVGGEGLRQFAKVILLGTIVGTYSSGFLATPLVFAWNEYKGNRLQQALASRKKKREVAKPIGRPGAIKPS